MGDDATKQDPHGAAETHVVNVGPSEDELVGRVFDGKYKIEALIGVGGMGRVYRARNTRTDSPVAIKTLLSRIAGDESLEKRFEIEAKAASNLRHPNTIRIFDFGREDDLLFMVMELLSGTSLEGVLKREGRLAPPRAVRIVKEACRSLAEAHAAGLIHRDMKPDNIFLNHVPGEEEHVKVLDFGVAKLQHNQFGNATLTQAGMIYGTPRYMSPEQARARPLDGRSDIYALGVILYECLTGLPPFEGSDPVSVLVKHVNEPVPSFRQKAPDLPPTEALEAIVFRCLAKEPDERFDDVHTLLNALDAAELRLGRHAGGATEYTAAETSALEPHDAGPDTPEPAVQREAFAALGVGTGPMGPSRYDIGPAVVEAPTLPQRRTRGPLPPGVIIGVVFALVVIAGGAIFGAIRTPARAVAPAPAPHDDGAIPAAMPSDGSDDGQHLAATPVSRTLEVRATTSGAAAYAFVEGLTPQPVLLPATLEIPAGPGGDATTVELEVTAEGHEPWRQAITVEDGLAPLEVTLRPPAPQERPADDREARPRPDTETRPERPREDTGAAPTPDDGDARLPEPEWGP